MLKEMKYTRIDKIKYKEKVGFNLIQDNKLLVKEFKMWCEIFNNYKQKLPLFYEHSKPYIKMFEKLNDTLTDLMQKVNMDEDIFYDKIQDFVYKYTTNYENKEICKIVNAYHN